VNVSLMPTLRWKRTGLSRAKRDLSLGISNWALESVPIV